MQTSPLQDFLTDLALDPAKYAAFMRDPDAVMRSAGLAAESRSVLKSGDSAAILRGLAEEAGEEGYKPGYRAYGGTIAAACPGPVEPFKPLK
jgi:hypothetical protein